jgi:hypothetical protein
LAPGDYLVIVKSLDAFTLRYGPLTNIAPSIVDGTVNANLVGAEPGYYRVTTPWR